MDIGNRITILAFVCSIASIMAKGVKVFLASKTNNIAVLYKSKRYDKNKTYITKIVIENLSANVVEGFVSDKIRKALHIVTTATGKSKIFMVHSIAKNTSSFAYPRVYKLNEQKIRITFDKLSYHKSMEIYLLHKEKFKKNFSLEYECIDTEFSLSSIRFMKIVKLAACVILGISILLTILFTVNACITNDEASMWCSLLFIPIFVALDYDAYYAITNFPRFKHLKGFYKHKWQPHR